MNPIKATSCPYCRSPNIRVRHNTHDWRCERCGNIFAQPFSTSRRHREGSGVIAGPTYGHQLAREILAQHEREKIAATVVKAPFNPGRRRSSPALRKLGRFV